MTPDIADSQEATSDPRSIGSEAESPELSDKLDETIRISVDTRIAWGAVLVLACFEVLFGIAWLLGYQLAGDESISKFYAGHERDEEVMILIFSALPAMLTGASLGTCAIRRPNDPNTWPRRLALVGMFMFAIGLLSIAVSVAFGFPPPLQGGRTATAIAAQGVLVGTIVVAASWAASGYLVARVVARRMNSTDLIGSSLAALARGLPVAVAGFILLLLASQVVWMIRSLSAEYTGRPSAVVGVPTVDQTATVIAIAVILTAIWASTSRRGAAAIKAAVMVELCLGLILFAVMCGFVLLTTSWTYEHFTLGNWLFGWPS